MSHLQELDHLRIPFDDIRLATNNFSQLNFLGHGGFGRVYRGQLPSSTGSAAPGTTVAVKRLDVKGGQGLHEFLMEIVMLASYKHHNLVSLVGFSDEGHEKVLVYKYEVNGSLDNHLASTNLNWEQRLKICLGAARGLQYLHDGVGTGHRVLHRDIKSSNILLDVNWEAKISDFGLSKIGPANHQFTFLVTEVCGTFGYVDPLYIDTGILTKESDVYSFGVVLFEVLCGRLAMMGEYEDERRFLSHLVQNYYEKGKLRHIIFSNLQEQVDPDSFQVFSDIAFQCLNEDRVQRPKMSFVVTRIETALSKANNYGSVYPPLPYFYGGYRICVGCNAEIGHGRFLNCMGGLWHPECFRCHSCNLPISDHEFSMSENRQFHKSCYKENHYPRCDVCKNFIPTNANGLIEYRAHPFWMQKYCPSHEHDETS